MAARPVWRIICNTAAAQWGACCGRVYGQKPQCTGLVSSSHVSHTMYVLYFGEWGGYCNGQQRCRCCRTWLWPNCHMALFSSLADRVLKGFCQLWTEVIGQYCSTVLSCRPKVLSNDFCPQLAKSLQDPVHKTAAVRREMLSLTTFCSHTANSTAAS